MLSLPRICSCSLTSLTQASLHAGIKKLKQADQLTLRFSRGISIVVLMVYVAYLYFLLKSPPQLSDQEAQTGTTNPIVQAIVLQDNTRASIELSSSTSSPKRVKDEAQPVFTSNGGIAYTPPELDQESNISKRASVILLLISAGFISICAEFLVDSIEHVVANARFSEAFLGLIILPLLGNTAELGTAVTVAIKNKMDLAINVTVGSAIQITLFMAPAMVALGWATGKDMSLEFDMFQTVALLITLVMVNFMLLSGRCNCLFGLLLFACYVIIGLVSSFEICETNG
jgi:Ca2+:H+ antiporter